MEKTIILGKTEGSRRRGRPNTRRIDSVNKATGVSLQLLGGAAEARTRRTCSFVGSLRQQYVTRRVVRQEAWAR